MSGTKLEQIERRLEEVNQQLSRCRLLIRGRTFAIRARFPPRPGETEPVRTHLSTGCVVSPAGLKAAIEKARMIDADLISDRFDWLPYLKGRRAHLKPAETVGEWVRAYTEDHWRRTEQTVNKQNSFHKNYELFFGRLPTGEPLAIALLEVEIITRYPKPGTRSRQLCAMAYASLAKFAGLPADQVQVIRELGKGYSPKSVDPRDLPSDNEILDIWQSIKDPGWRFVVALLAIYGVRSHEVWACWTDRLSESPPILEVKDETKTGKRSAFPCPGLGWDEMVQALRSPVFPKIATEGKANNALGDKVGQYLRVHGSAYTPLDFRHAYARRMYERGFDSRLAARSMGHSRDVHERIYSAWWGEAPFLERFKQVMGDRSWEPEQEPAVDRDRQSSDSEPGG